MNDDLHASVETAREILSALGFDAERSNERSARVLLALCGLELGTCWQDASGLALGVTPIMERAAAWGPRWAPNTRETIRRFTLHQFQAAGLVEYNHDDPSRPVNSPRANYRLSPSALTVIRSWGTAEASGLLTSYLQMRPGQIQAYIAARDLVRIPVTLPDGDVLTLSPGGQNVLLRQIVEDFAPRFVPGGQVLFLGDAESHMGHLDTDGLAALGIDLAVHGKLPDLVLHDKNRNWLVLCEAASSHGPVDAKRHTELADLFKGADAGLVYVSCFPDRATMRKYLAALAWETEAWCATEPDHLVHLNGCRFLGPY